MTTPRIVSLLPGATEIIFALGLGDLLVGRSHECDFPAAASVLPVCSAPRLDPSKPSHAIHEDVTALLESALSVFQIDTEMLRRLKPTHIVTQDLCQMCAVSAAEVAEAAGRVLGVQPVIVSLSPRSFTEIFQNISTLADALEARSSAESLLVELSQRVAFVGMRAKVATNRPSVGAIEWLDPLMASGNWVPEMIEIAAGRPVFATVDRPSPRISWRQIVTTDPDILLIKPCGFALERTCHEVAALTELREWPALKAVRTRRVYLFDGNAYFNRPGPRIVDSLEILAECLHPHLFHPVHEDQAWRRLS